MLVEATTAIASRITGAIRDAARATGASFDYLLKTALRESNLNPAAQAPTSSAQGLFQFIDQTWLATVKQAGPALGYGDAAQSIVQTRSGRYVVPDAARRSAVMNLRNDPAASAAMAGALTRSNAAVLSRKLGRAPTDGELYIAHFMGANGATKLIKSAAAKPEASAAALFPHAAKVNRSIFYDRGGGARSTAQVYAQLVSRHEKTRAPDGIAAIVAAMAQDGAAPAAARGQATATAAAPPAPAAGESVPVRATYAGGEGPVFYGLFRTDSRAPVSEAVNRLWGAPLADTAADASGAAARTVAVEGSSASEAAPAAGKPLNLFQFLHHSIRAGSGPA